MEELHKRIEAVEKQLKDIVVLTPWQIRIIQWTANAIGGLATLVAALLAVSTVAKALKDIGSFIP